MPSRRNDSAALAALVTQLLDESITTLDPTSARQTAAATGMSAAFVLNSRALWLRTQLQSLVAGDLMPERVAHAVGLLREFREEQDGTPHAETGRGDAMPPPRRV